MSMISELVEELIDNADLYTKELHDLMYRAADTIEMLSEKAKEPKQGEWIEVESYENEKHSVTDMRCNLCGKYSQMVLPYKTKCVYPHCPFCGARMKGASE